MRLGVTDLLIDPFNELEQARGNMSETEYIGRMLQRIRSFALRHGRTCSSSPIRAKVKPAKPGESFRPRALRHLRQRSLCQQIRHRHHDPHPRKRNAASPLEVEVQPLGTKRHICEHELRRGHMPIFVAPAIRAGQVLWSVRRMTSPFGFYAKSLERSPVHDAMQAEAMPVRRLRKRPASWAGAADEPALAISAAAAQGICGGTRTRSRKAGRALHATRRAICRSGSSGRWRHDRRFAPRARLARSGAMGGTAQVREIINQFVPDSERGEGGDARQALRLLWPSCAVMPRLGAGQATSSRRISSSRSGRWPPLRASWRCGQICARRSLLLEPKPRA